MPELLIFVGNNENSLNFNKSWLFGRKLGSFCIRASINYLASGAMLVE